MKFPYLHFRVNFFLYQGKLLIFLIQNSHNSLRFLTTFRVLKKGYHHRLKKPHSKHVIL